MSESVCIYTIIDRAYERHGERENGRMELLFKRDQTAGAIGKVKFKLWGKVELDQDEQEIVKRYRFDNAVLIVADQSMLLRMCALMGAGAFVVAFAVFASFLSTTIAFLAALVAGGGAAYWYFNEKRETILVKDLIHGRYFTCDSVVELARKEAWLALVSSFLRQVMESAKHWDGTERHDIEALPKDEARQVIIKGL